MDGGMGHDHDHGMMMGGGGGGGGMAHGGGQKKMMMHMTFFWGKNAEILFSGWPGTSTGMYILALIFVFVLSILIEWLSNLQLLNKPGSRDLGAGLVQTFIHTVRVGLAYLVMLAIMSFNGGVFVAVIAGHFIGCLVFGSRVFRRTEVPLHPMTC